MMGILSIPRSYIVIEKNVILYSLRIWGPSGVTHINGLKARFRSQSNGGKLQREGALEGRRKGE